MEGNKETLQLNKDVLKGEEFIKASVPFKKGVIAGILILILILCIGIVIGYSIGQGIATDHYTRLLQECQNKSLMLW